jgi:2-phospho-L-lactate guanylyltransferase
MTIVAALPVRGLADGKSRLRATLPDLRRRALILALLEHVARALRESSVVTTVLVSPDPVLLEWAAQRDLDITPLLQTNTGLIGGLWQATEWAKTQATATALLAIHADLPLLAPQHVRDMVAALARTGERPAVVVAGDRHHYGTNALLARPAGVIPFRFGEQSFVRHQGEAAARGITVIPMLADGLSLDLDTPDDVQVLTATNPSAATALWDAVERLIPVAHALAQRAPHIYPCPAIPTSEVRS